MPEAIFWKEVEEGWIRYDQSAGSTLLITPLARFVIDLIDERRSPLALPDIVEAVQRAEPDATPADCHIEVEAALRALSDVQLIRAIQP